MNPFGGHPPGLVNLMPVFWSIFADQFLGSRKAVTVDAILMVVVLLILSPLLKKLMHLDKSIEAGKREN